METAAEERNKAFVLEAFDTLFNRCDYAAAQRFWSPDYIQHSAHIAPGPEGLFELRKQVADYEASGGLEGATLEGRPVVILTSVGAAGRYRNIDRTPPSAPLTVPRRPHEQEYGGTEYGGLPVNCSRFVIMLSTNIFRGRTVCR
ncbi:MAG: hypothetical protein QOE52_179 [Mycobacterium sp.]|nr:hypothetical protein [Mycobacterium sp.]